MDMNSINWLAVLVAGVSAFVLGGVWYSPALFGKAWMKENKMTVEEVQKGNKAGIFGWAFVPFAYYGGQPGRCSSPSLPPPCPGAPVVSIFWGATAGFPGRHLEVFCSIAVVALFEHRTSPLHLYQWWVLRAGPHTHGGHYRGLALRMCRPEPFEGQA